MLWLVGVCCIVEQFKLLAMFLSMLQSYISPPPPKVSRCHSWGGFINSFPIFRQFQIYIYISWGWKESITGLPKWSFSDDGLKTARWRERSSPLLCWCSAENNDVAALVHSVSLIWIHSHWTFTNYAKRIPFIYRFPPCAYRAAFPNLLNLYTHLSSKRTHSP